MGRRREILPPHEATNDGARRLRELLVTELIVTIARKLGCDEGCVRHYAREVRKPDASMRARVQATLGIPGSTWDLPPAEDAYEVDPETRRTRTPRIGKRPKSRSRKAKGAGRRAPKISDSGGRPE